MSLHVNPVTPPVTQPGATPAPAPKAPASAAPAPAPTPAATVDISSAARQQAKPVASGDVDHDGDSH